VGSGCSLVCVVCVLAGVDRRVGRQAGCSILGRRCGVGIVLYWWYVLGQHVGRAVLCWWCDWCEWCGWCVCWQE